MISWVWTVFPVSTYEVHNAAVTIKTMSSSCIQTTTIYYQLYRGMLLSSMICEKRPPWKFITEKMLDFHQREIFSWNVKFIRFVIFVGKRGTLNPSHEVLFKQNWEVWHVEVKPHNFLFHPQTTEDVFKLKIKNSSSYSGVFQQKLLNHVFLPTLVQIASLLVLTTSLGLRCSISSSSLFSFSYLNASVGTKASLNDDICSSLIQNMI